MLRFKGFRASLNFSSGKNSGLDYDEVPTVTMTGAYRQNTEEFTESGTITTKNKTITPSMVVLPPSSQPLPPRRSKTKNDLSKSTDDLTEANSGADNTPPMSHSKSSGNVSSNPRGTEPYRDREPTNVNAQKDSKNKKAKKEKQPKNKDIDSKNPDKESKKADKEIKKREKEQKKLEKKQIEEQKKRDKLEAQALQLQEKVQKEREKAEAKQRAKEQKVKKDKDKTKSEPMQNRGSDPVTQTLTNPLAQGSRNPNTDTLKSSTSLSSAPPPYSETSEDRVIRKGAIRKDVRNERNENESTGHTSFGKPRKDIVKNEAVDVGQTSYNYNPRKEIISNESDNTGNTSFGKPVGETPGGSWDMVSQHREQINRTAKGGTRQKIVNDSQYVTGRTSILNR